MQFRRASVLMVLLAASATASTAPGSARAASCDVPYDAAVKEMQTPHHIRLTRTSKDG